MAYKLISFELCPFVQRSVITLLEKDVPHEIEYVDLSAKPDWFVKISPFGKVPLLQIDGTVLFESAVINEYLDETTDGSFMPETPLERARVRMWIELTSALLGDVYRLMVAKETADYDDSARKIRDKLMRLEAEVTGPLFLGDSFSLMDAAIAPALQRLAWSEAIDPTLDLFDETPKVAAWRDALLSRDSVVRSTIPNIREVFAEYLQGRGTPTRNVEPSVLGRKIEPRRA